jgi:glycosyltransferase involved in cell wall biosynthesis
MPTRNRRRFVAQSISYFLRQDYAPRELIIIDDGEDNISDLVPTDKRIRYIHHPRRVSLGAKRNLACQEAAGELIAHWDDDDWMAFNRLSTQVRTLHESCADVCGIRDLLHFHIESGEAWLYRHSPHERPWLAGNTLLYWREIWERHRFPEINVGEDSVFLWQISGDRLCAVQDTSFYVALIHAANTAHKNLKDRHWEKRPIEEVSRLIDSDRDFYVRLRNGQPQAEAKSFPSSVTVAAWFMIWDGYGSLSEPLVLSMARAGAKVNVRPLHLHREGLKAEVLNLIDQSKPEPDAPGLFFAPPGVEREILKDTSEYFINTMWESSLLPASWPPLLNQARGVIVPTRFVRRICHDSGVNVPVEVVPEGIDPDIYHYKERPAREGITTLIVGLINERKHAREGIAAWKLAFADDPTARLIIKAHFQLNNYIPDDPRIILVDTNEATRGIAHWYQKADVLLALGNEGFGLPLVEGMATGLPVIALSSEGQGDLCEDAHDLVLSVPPAHWQPSDDTSLGPAGIRGVPDVNDIAARLRWVATHQDDARAMGRAASEWVLRHRNIWAKGPAVIDVMEHYLENPRSLRQNGSVNSQ